MTAELSWRQQPARKLLGARVGACACEVCGWRTWKFAAMLGGWDAFERGAVTICPWCRFRLGGISARELAELGAGDWRAPKAADVWQGSLVRSRRTKRWARVIDFPESKSVRVEFVYRRQDRPDRPARRRSLPNAVFLATFEILAGTVEHPLRGRGAVAA